MITSLIAGQRTSRGWQVSEFEHEALLNNGQIADLKASFGFDVARLGTDWFEIEMSRSLGGPSILLRWEGLTKFDSRTLGPVLPAEDGRVGIIGMRLLEEPGERLQFEIEMDWLRIEIACKKFYIRE